jgi:hypothetical protein
MEENQLKPESAALQGRAGILKATIEIVRADTGKTEVVEIVGTAVHTQPDESEEP